jgi:acyl-coenzyme A synthetase/AMP-(fatty) acid ligase
MTTGEPSNSENFNLTEYILSKNSENFSDKKALIFYNGNDKQIFTYKEIYDKSVTIAEYLLYFGFKPGNRLVIRMENSPEYIFSFLGIIAAGMTAIPVSSQLTEEEVSFILRESKAEGGIFDGKLPTPRPSDETILVQYKEIKEPKQKNQQYTVFNTKPYEEAFIVYTSGSSGYPKGVIHAHRSILGRIPMFENWTDLKEEDIILHAGQLNWTYTLGVGIMDPLSIGATTILTNGKREPSEWADIIKSEKASIFATVPSLFRRILKHADLTTGYLSSLRHCLSAGESLLPSVYTEWTHSTGKEIFEALGMTEVSTFISTSKDIPYRAGSTGVIQKGRNVVILPIDGGTTPVVTGNIGVLAVSIEDDGLFLDYTSGSKQDSIRDDFFITGDLVHSDIEGYIYYHGRNDDIMNSFGYRVSPSEVERVLETHPMISEAGVTEVKKKDNITLISAFIVLKEGRSGGSTDIKSLEVYLKDHLATYKIPKEFYFVNDLPRNRNGKLQRKKLAQLLPETL